MDDGHHTQHEDFERRVRGLLGSTQPKVDLDRAKERLLHAIDRRRVAEPLWRRLLSVPRSMREYAAPGLALAAAVVFLLSTIMSSKESLGQLSGDLAVFRPLTASWVKLASQDVPADVLLRVDGQESTLTLEEGSKLTLRHGCVFELSQDKGIGLTLHRGQLIADIISHSPDEPFRVTTPTMQVTVLGTRFTVTVEDSK